MMMLMMEYVRLNYTSLEQLIHEVAAPHFVLKQFLIIHSCLLLLAPMKFFINS
jgi:hypothetical protein